MIAFAVALALIGLEGAIVAVLTPILDGVEHVRRVARKHRHHEVSLLRAGVSEAVPAPGYWMNETSGVLRPAVEAYLGRDEMTPEEIAAMRAYLRQWICRGAWRGPEIEGLKARVDGLDSRQAIDAWLHEAEKEGIDPL